MVDQKSRDAICERLIEYFESSGFSYLALDYAGASVRLSRERPAQEISAAAVSSEPTHVLASSVGFIESPAERRRFPQSGDQVAEGEALFAIRRFRNVLAVSAPASGILGSVLVSAGDFVEFGQPLATVLHTPSPGDEGRFET